MKSSQLYCDYQYASEFPLNVKQNNDALSPDGYILWPKQKSCFFPLLISFRFDSFISHFFPEDEARTIVSKYLNNEKNVYEQYNQLFQNRPQRIRKM